MLVLSRKPGEKVCVDGVITITVLEVRGGRVRLGIDAPEGLPVLRAELGPVRPEAAPGLPPAAGGRLRA